MKSLVAAFSTISLLFHLFVRNIDTATSLKKIVTLMTLHLVVFSDIFNFTPLSPFSVIAENGIFKSERMKPYYPT